MKRLLKLLEFSFFLTGSIGVMLIAMSIRSGWILSIFATGIGMTWGILSRNKWIAFQNLVYMIFNSLGAYRSFFQ